MDELRPVLNELAQVIINETLENQTTPIAQTLMEVSINTFGIVRYDILRAQHAVGKLSQTLERRVYPDI